MIVRAYRVTALFFSVLTGIAYAANAAPGQTTAANSLTQQCQQLGKLLKLRTDSVCAPAANGAISVASSHQQRSIFAVRRGAKLSEPSATRVLILGAVHGDELTAGWLALQWAGFDVPRSPKRDYAVLHVPITNPDGVFETKPSRVNGRGVDLNRNFPTPNWKAESAKWWNEKTKRDPRRFPGNTAASEHETRYVMRVIETFQPTVVVSIHAPLGVLDYDGGGLPPQRIGSIWLDMLGIYPGSLGHYASRIRGVPVLTVELPHAINAVNDTESRKMWRDLFVWIDKYSNLDSQSK